MEKAGELNTQKASADESESAAEIQHDEEGASDFQWSANATIRTSALMNTDATTLSIRS